MNHVETVALLRRIKARKPAQMMDEYTADVWAEDLANIRYEDADLAVGQLNREIQFIGTADIVARVRHIRSERIGKRTYTPSRPGMTVAEEVAECRDFYRRVGDGEDVPEPSYAALPQRPPIAILTKTVPKA